MAQGNNEARWTPSSVSVADPSVILTADGRLAGRAFQLADNDPAQIARLWAAAPDLVEALKTIVKIDTRVESKRFRGKLSHAVIEGPSAKIARAALAKLEPTHDR